MPKSTGVRYTEEFKAEAVQLARSSPASSSLIVPHLWAGTPQTGTLGFGFLAQPLELAAVGVGEGGGAGEP